MQVMNDDTKINKLQSLRDKNIAVIHQQLRISEDELDHLLMKNEEDLQKSIHDLRKHHAQISDNLREDFARKSERLQGLLQLERYQLGVMEHIGSDDMLHLYITLEKDARGIENGKSQTRRDIHSYRPQEPFLYQNSSDDENKFVEPVISDTHVTDIVSRYKARGGILPKRQVNHDSDPALQQEYKDFIKLKNWRQAVHGSLVYKITEEVKTVLDENMPGWNFQSSQEESVYKENSIPENKLFPFESKESQSAGQLHIHKFPSSGPKYRRKGYDNNSFFVGETVVTIGSITKRVDDNVLDDTCRSIEGTLQYGEDSKSNIRNYRNTRANSTRKRLSGGYTDNEYSIKDLRASNDIRALDVAIDKVKIKSSRSHSQSQASNDIPITPHSTSMAPKIHAVSKQRANDKLDLRIILKKFENHSISPKVGNEIVEKTGTSSIHAIKPKRESRGRSIRSQSVDKSTCMISNNNFTRNASSLSPEGRRRGRRVSSPNKSLVLIVFQNDGHLTHVNPYITFNDLWRKLLFDYEVMPSKPTAYSRSILARLIGFQLRDNMECYERFIEIWNSDIFKVNVLNVFCLEFKVTKKNAAIRARGLFQGILLRIFPRTVEQVKLFRKCSR